MNETLFKVELEKINYYEKFLKNEIFKRNDFISKDVVTSIVIYYYIGLYLIIYLYIVIFIYSYYYNIIFITQ